MMKKLIVLILISMLVISLVGCGAQVNVIEFDKDSIDLDITNRSTEFAFNIFKELNKEETEDNIFISPLSISTALTMTYNGAEGKTKEDMAMALEYAGVEIEKINNTYKNLLPYLSQIDDSINLDISNSIWYRLGEPIKGDFINTNRDVFNAKVSELDFLDTASVDTINKWIENSTNSKIDKMLNPPIPSDVIMYLINAVYFKGDWTDKFDKKDTFPTLFNSIDGEEQEVQMMSKVNKVDYGEADDYKAVRLPYGEEKVSMYFILPKGNNNINDLIENMNLDKLNNIRNSIFETENVVLNIPRFELEYGIKNLNNVLINMGMGSAFQIDANFSKIREGIFISRVLHKAVIEVNEEGSEAAGVTVVEMTESAIMEPISFVANRPFMFLIMDEDTGTILFMGKYCQT